MPTIKRLSERSSWRVGIYRQSGVTIPDRGSTLLGESWTSQNRSRILHLMLDPSMLPQMRQSFTAKTTRALQITT